VTWPWPSDTALARARRVAQAYRSALEAISPETCATIDAQMTHFGQRWIIPQLVTYTDNDLLSADLVADYCGVALKTVYEWRRRGLPSVTTPDGIRFRFSDVRQWPRR
jgi:hypothetical protein